MKNGMKTLLSKSKLIKLLRDKVSRPLDTLFYNFLFFTLIIGVLLFILLPSFSVIKESLYFDGNLSFELYKDLFQDNAKLLSNSFLVASLTTILTIFLSLNTALYLSYTEDKVKKFILIILLLTMISPPFVSSLAYIKLFGRRGFITHGLLGLNLNTYGWHGVVLMQTFSHTSLATLIITGVLQGIDNNIINAAQDLKADLWHILKDIIIPLAKPGIIVAALLTFVKSLADFGTPIIIGGSFNVLATEAYLNVIAYFNLPRAAALNVLLLIPALLAFIVYWYYMKNTKIEIGRNVKTVNLDNNNFKLTGWVKNIITFVTWFFIIFIILQYLTIFLSAITKYNNGNLVITLKHIKGFNMKELESFFRSLRYAFITGIVGSIIGLLLSYFIEKSNIKGIKIIDMITTLPYIMPGTFFGIGYLLAFNNKPLLLVGTTLIVQLNFIYRQMPLVTKSGNAILSKINPNIEEAAKDLGATKMSIIKDIIMPLLKPAFLISFVNNFAVTMTSIGAVIFLIYPGESIATVEMFNNIENGDYGIGAVIACMIIFSTLVINLIFSKFLLKD
ncbi:MAG: ABC transporter permease, partial [Bacillota bacterium]